MNPNLLSIIINLFSSLIYDGMKAGTSSIFSGMRDKITENRVREAVVKATTKELENKVGQSRIFDCDAMHNYVEHMKPIQKIYQYAFSPRKYADISVDELIRELQKDTSEYLLENGKRVSPLDEIEIKEFYSSVIRICDDVSDSLLEPTDIALARLLLRGSENSKSAIVSEIDKSREFISSEFRCYGNMVEQSFQKMNEAIANRNETFTMAIQRSQKLEVTPYKYIGGSEKEQYVKKLTSNFRKCNWIHIYGKMFTGKTQTMVRVTEHVASWIWITVRDNEFQNISLKEMDLQGDTVVIIDGIPNMAKPGVKEKCLQILSECKEKKCKLITTGYENAEVYVKGFVIPDELISIELNGFTEDEVDEIMRNHNAPEGLFHTKGYRNFVELCKELPPIVMEVVHRMEANGWKYDDDVFMAILTRKTESVEEQMKYLFLDAVDDVEARRLYYRIVYANRAIEKKWMQPIAAIPEKINQSDKNMEILRNRWIYTDGRLYRCPNKILQNYAEEQLSQEEKRAINEFMVKEITKHSLEPLDVSDLFLYYSRLENFDAQGILCYQIMEQMIENDVKDYLINVEMFWQEMPLPEKMSSFIKVLLRAEQLYYRVWRGDLIKDFEAKRAELWSIASDDICKVLVGVFGIKFAIIDVKSSLLFFKDFLERYGETINILEKLQHRLDELDTFDVPEILMENSMFSVFNSMLGLNISKLDDSELYIEVMRQYFTIEQWKEVETIENIDAIILCMLDRVWKNSEGQMERYLNVIQCLFSMLSEETTPILWKSVLHSYLLGYQKANNYEEAKTLYISVMPIMKKNPVGSLEIIDEMARIAHDNNDLELEQQLFRWEMQLLSKNNAIVLNEMMIDSCLLYLDGLGAEDRSEIENVHKIMRNITCDSELYQKNPLLLERLDAEYWMKIYLIGDIEAEMSGFLLFVESLLDEFKRNESIAIKSILTKMCHVLGYLGGKFLRNSVPDKFPDGSDYASPKLRMFWNDVKDTEVISYWKSEKIEMMYYICASLSDKYGMTESGNRLFQEMIATRDFWNETIECMYKVESYLQFKFLEQKEWNNLAYFMQKTYEPKVCELLGSNEGYYFIAREQMIFSVYILQIWQDSVQSALELCARLIEVFDEQRYNELAQRYYKEYKKVLQLVVNEDADFDLLAEAFSRIQKKQELLYMDSGIFPLLLLQVPKSRKAMLKENVISTIKKLHFDNDFMMEKYIEMLRIF